MKLLLIAVGICMAGCESSLVSSGVSDAGDVGGVNAEIAVEPFLYKSGRRLRAWKFVSPGGAEGIVGWRDTKLQVNCSVSESYEPGISRCYPEGIRHASIGFSDPLCSLAVFGQGALPPTLHGRYKYGRIRIAEINRYYELGPIYVGPMYRISGDSCIEVAPDPQMMYAQPGLEVPVSIFQAVTLQVE